MKVFFLCATFLCGSVFAQFPREEAEKYAKEVFEKLAAGLELQDGEISAGGKTMPYFVKQYGEAKVGERSLWISMHGGGGAPARVNDQQWENQKRLYVPEEGFYVAPRAPTNTWNLWHESHIDLLFGKLIENFVAKHGVNPNQVYLMGYSAGGDGVYQLAPRMADWFGAASMMAGHPNDASPDGLKNLPFRIYMGGRDAAYDRNKIAAEWGRKLARLQAFRGGYEHKVTIYPELGHWMRRRDAEAVPWMAGKIRNPWPKNVIWGQSSIRSKRFYWLGGDVTSVVAAKVIGQRIEIFGGGEELTLWLNDQLIDLEHPVQVIVNQKEVFNAVVPRSKEAVEKSLKERLDLSMVATAMIVLPGKSIE